MLALISNNKSNQYYFSNLCKNANKDYLILESIFEIFEHAEIIKKSFIIIDYKNIARNEALAYKGLKDTSYKNFLVVHPDYEIKNINEAVAVALYELKKGDFSKELTLVEDATEKIIKEYGFKRGYEGYKYLVIVCKNHILENNNKINFKKSISDISKYYGLKGTVIERNIRYIIQINTNKDIVNVRGGNCEVKTKMVIEYLVEKINEKLNRYD